MLGKAKSYMAGVAAALLTSVYAPALHAQENKPKTEKAQAAPSDKVKVSGIGVNTTAYENGLSASTASLTFFTFPKSELWLVGGQDYGNGKNDFDIGLKYVRGNNLLRGTLVSSKDKRGEQKISAGADWDVVLAPYENGGVSLLGDVSSVGNGERRTDFGIGTKLRLNKNHNAFFLYSNRGEERASGYRAGYMFLDDEKIAALVADYPEGGKAAFTGYLGLPEHRFIASFDPNNHDVSSVNVFTFGNKPMPYYARASFLSSQLILTQHSVTDSDYNHLFQSPFFLDPKGKVGDVARLHFSYDAKNDVMKSLYFYNALMVKNKEKSGLVLTQNIDKKDGKMYYGGGIGYKFGQMTPVVIFQAGDKRRITFDLDFSY